MEHLCLLSNFTHLFAVTFALVVECLLSESCGVGWGGHVFAGNVLDAEPVGCGSCWFGIQHEWSNAQLFAMDQ
jgi:hypothetical protein